MGVLRYKMHHSDGFSLKVAFFFIKRGPPYTFQVQYDTTQKSAFYVIYLIPLLRRSDTSKKWVFSHDLGVVTGDFSKAFTSIPKRQIKI